MLYQWVLAGHVTAVITWMAGMFYLPRLFVYHANTEVGSETSEIFKVMERKLLKYIMNPGMIAAWGFAIWLLALNPALFEQGWFHVKLVAVLGMTLCHAFLARWRRLFAADANMRSHRFYRVANEAPTLLLLVIIIMVIVKPF